MNFGWTTESRLKTCTLLSVFFAASQLACATERFVSTSGGHVPPFTNWLTAANDIQSAIDAASAGDLIWVTNGVYGTGGKVMAGDLTNRVALDKPLTVRSVNGPFSTVIQGAGITNGADAVRCAWLTNSAALIGFTLRFGATRTLGDTVTLRSGGGVWGASNSIVANCVIISNNASFRGCGVYGGALNNCFISANGSSTSASAVSLLPLSSMVNCTVVSNATGVNLSSIGPAAAITNCIIYFSGPFSFQNYSGNLVFSHCCTTPLPTGDGNIGDAPQLAEDRLHLRETSPCIAAGTNVATGTDIENRNWGNPPSIGCIQWQPAPQIIVQPTLRLTNDPVGFVIGTASAVGEEPLAYQWLKGGTVLEDDGHYTTTKTPRLLVNGVKPWDGGQYQVVVSNQFGMATSAVATAILHFVDANSSSPTAPYTNWAAAAATIQDAVDAASAQEFILVTNGLYSTGGRAMSDNQTNRIVVDKAVIVQSVNGPEFTVIEGAWNPQSTNGSLAVRGAWLTNGAVLSGFVVRNGATGTNSFYNGSGGGVFALSNAAIANCVISNNFSRYNGAGCMGGILDRCFISWNQSYQSGGGVAAAVVRNSCVTENSAKLSGGGAYQCSLLHCTITYNSAGIGIFNGSGGYEVAVTNSIVWGNFGNSSMLDNLAGNFTATYTCTDPKPSGVGNTNINPQLMDSFHLSIFSPCRGAANPTFSSGSDLDVEAWTNPPSMGCDEVWEAGIVGPLNILLWVSDLNTVERNSTFLPASMVGRVSAFVWSYGDGSVATNGFPFHTWLNAGDYEVTLTAFNADHPKGVSTNILVHVAPLLAPIISESNLGGNSFTLTFAIQAGIIYYVEQTSDLTPPITWRTVGYGYSSSGDKVVQVTDTMATNAVGFYRIRVP